MSHLAERLKFAGGAEPKNYTGAAMADSYVSMKHFGRLTIVIRTGAWAGGTAAVTLLQATAVAGTAAKALAFVDYWDDVATTGTLVKKAATSNTFTIGAANKVYIIHVDVAMLDVTGGFDAVSLGIATPGVNADFYSVLYIGECGRYQGSSIPSTLVD